MIDTDIKATPEDTKVRVGDCPHCRAQGVAVQLFRCDYEWGMICPMCHAISPAKTRFVPLKDVKW